MESHPHGSGPALQFTTGFSEVCRPVKTFHLRDIYSPKPLLQRTPVAIRPPSPKPGPSLEPVIRRRQSCEPEPKPIMRRRAKSLSSSREEHTWRNVQVRFVDSLGLELEDVKFFKTSEDPMVPVHVITRLLASSELASRKKLELSLPYFQPSFTDNMHAEAGFLERLCRQQVCLEQVFCSELGIIGTVQVLNLAYEKRLWYDTRLQTGRAARRVKRAGSPASTEIGQIRSRTCFVFTCLYRRLSCSQVPCYSLPSATGSEDFSTGTTMVDVIIN